ncbi:hypothetical protein FORC81_p471 (plasmid) [Escherichia coli]|nr:hypothetical protein FORC81_p471 [Escherichia coli]
MSFRSTERQTPMQPGNGVWNPVSSAPSIRMAVVSTGIRMCMCQ